MKASKPAAFGSGKYVCVISSIAGFARARDEDGNPIIRVDLKSGASVLLNFKVQALTDIAYEKLSEYFEVETAVNNPCSCCTKKDKHAALSEGYGKDTSHCDVCFNFDRFEFKE